MRKLVAYEIRGRGEVKASTRIYDPSRGLEVRPEAGLGAAPRHGWGERLERKVKKRRVFHQF
jgi:hypothetical protein